MNLIEFIVIKYGRPDKGRKEFNVNDLFVVDDRQDKDFDARGQLFLWFCEMRAQVVNNAKIRVMLTGDVPKSSAVTALLESFSANFYDDYADFFIQPDYLARFDSLAEAFRDIVAPGKRYSVKSYKYVCPRTADSLLRLRDNLREFWSQIDPAMIEPILVQRELNLDLQ